ncbi:MAG TPA: ABC transporter substrate-binding protein [Pseudolysinimonas sp.]
MRRPTVALLAVCASTALILSACSGTNTPAETPGVLASSVRIISGGSASFSDAAINKAEALLEAQGVHVEASLVDDPATALRAVVSGQADVALLDPVEAIKAVANGAAPVKYIGSLSQTTDYVIIALPGVTLDDLDGKTFATAGAGTAGDVIASAALAESNVDMSKVQKVTVGGTSARITSILAGQVDMAPVHAADAVPAIATGKVQLLMNTGEVLGQYLQQGLIASDNWLKDKTTAQAVVSAFIDAERWASQNEDQYIRTATDNDLLGDMSADDAKQGYQQLKDAKIFATNGALCEAAVKATLSHDYEVPDGGLTADNTPAYKKWVDPTFVNAYLKKNDKDSDGFC